ncbi:Type II secretion system F domain protein [[Leptolyngbya] sp. PCC 7376]|uniref:type II secretion system F family protein n=1 Tax=[Leptolyngbya] sp. PCC 7376 TaxID=111781 RepID=UPI00029ECFA4|nr:type II secretion system F family protein [[Leptolyngbya] sp. PCC 7376]AFY39329.1 Type II secretion system F domain protein [[Leptolyngbya] sp. PCC 7376]
MDEQRQAVFFRELAATLKAGVGLGQAVRLSSLSAKGKRREQWQRIALKLDRGASLHSSLRSMTKEFSPWAIAVVGMAEKSGALAIACEDLAETLLEMSARRRLIRGMVLRLFRMLWSWAMVIFLLLGGVVTGIQFWFVATFVALGLVGFIYAAIHWQPLGDRLRSLPPFKNLYALQTLIHLGYLQLPLDCGVSLGTALTWLKRDFPDPGLKQILQRVEPQVRRGKPLSELIHPHVSLMVAQMIRTGEEAGTLPQSFKQIRQYHQRDLRRSIQLLNLQVLFISLMSFGFFVFLVGAQILNLLVNTAPTA